MITFTDTARQKVREYMDMSETPSLGVRVVAHRFGRHQFRYELALVTEFGPRFVAEEDGPGTIEGFFTFQTPQAWCRGVARIHEVDGVWRAWTVMTGMEDLKGHERALGSRLSPSYNV